MPIALLPEGERDAADLLSLTLETLTDAELFYLGPVLVSVVGGPSNTEQHDDMVAFKPVGAADPWSPHSVRPAVMPWSVAEVTWAGFELLPPIWMSLISLSEFTIYLEDYNIPGPAKNFVPPQWIFGGLYLGNSIWLRGGLDETYMAHEIAHHVGYVMRPRAGIQAIVDRPATPTAVDALASEMLAAIRAVEATHGGSGAIYAASNIAELVAESYRYLIMKNLDPSYLASGIDGYWPSGIRADAWILTMCGGNTDLANRWTAELTRPEIWPAAPWPVHRTMASQAAIDAHRNTGAGGIPIQNLDSNEGPTLLLADATNGYRLPTEAVGTTLTKWTRSDRPLSLYIGSGLLVSAGTPTAEVRTTNMPSPGPPVTYVNLAGGPSEKWRTTITFRMGELLAGDKTLWRAAQTTVGGVYTEYAITWNGATVSASLTTRMGGATGAVSRTTKVTSGNILTTTERCTVQAIWGGQNTPITLRHRTASASAVTELTSSAMPPDRAKVNFWFLEPPHAANGPTLSYCALAAVAVETIHDDGLGPFTWMDAEYA